MKRVVAAVLLLALLGVAGCGEDPSPAVPARPPEPATDAIGEPGSQEPARSAPSTRPPKKAVPNSAPPPTWAKVSIEQIAEAKKHGVPVAFENDLGMRFVLIPAGTFLMGSPHGDCRYPEDTTRKVTLTHPFYMLITEVSNAQFRLCEPEHDSGRYKDLALNERDQPVVRVSWERAVAYATWLSDRDSDRDYSLPSEAQWEYACRAGTKARYYWGDSPDGRVQYENLLGSKDGRIAWKGLLENPPVCPGEDGHVVSAPVGSFLPNPWSLHDTLGNAREWCSDYDGVFPEGHLTDPVGPKTGTRRIVRGGGWFLGDPEGIGAACRGSFIPTSSWFNAVGFRLVSPLPEPKPGK